MNDLPDFDRRRPYEHVRTFAGRALAHGNTQFLRDLVTYPDGRYRAVFDPAYFVLAEGRTEPSKSQWNTLKKHFKRMDRSVLMLKAHGFNSEGLAYVEFGFFQD